MSAVQLARKSGIRQQNLSRWLQEARSLPFVTSGNRMDRTWTVEQKARVVAEAAKLADDELAAHLEREGVKLADFERWRIALENDSSASITAARRIRELEGDLPARKKLSPRPLLSWF